MKGYYSCSLELSSDKKRENLHLYAPMSLRMSSGSVESFASETAVVYCNFADTGTGKR